MLKYLTIPLSSNCKSYCHYLTETSNATEFIAPEMLSKIVVWAMKENLSIQFLYPEIPISKSLESITESIDHIKIVPESNNDKQLLGKADIIVTPSFVASEKLRDKIYIVHTTFEHLIDSAEELKQLTKQSRKVNVILTDADKFTQKNVNEYRAFLSEMAEFIAEEYIKGNYHQLNLITDRIMLKEMNNCNAGVESIAVAIDGTLYPCPGFIGDKQFACGNIENGFGAPNLQLYSITRAPICKICDAYHCNRCVWLNKNLTHEVNTPGRQQCYIAHLEREASKTALEKIRAKFPDFLTEIAIPQLDYLDPYSIIKNL